MVDEINLTLKNSGIHNTTVRLVKAATSSVPDEYNYHSTVEEGTGKVIVMGAQDEIFYNIFNDYGLGSPDRALVDIHNADIYAYVRDGRESDENFGNLGSAGFDGLLVNIIDFYMVSDYSKTSVDYGPHTAAHEFAHLLGAMHEDDPSLVAEYDARAHQCANRITTVYASAKPNQHSVYSSPDVFIKGDACGIEGVADNVRSIKSNIPAKSVVRTPVEVNAQIAFAQDSFSVDELTGNEFISLVRTGDTSYPARADIILYNDSATAKVDVAQDVITAEFAVGQTRIDVPLTVIADNVEEGTEYLTATLDFPAYATVNTDDIAVIRIDDAPASSGDLYVTMNDSVLEGEPLHITVARANGATGDINARVRLIPDTAVIGEDIEALDAQVTIPDGQESVSLSVATLYNSAYEVSGSDEQLVSKFFTIETTTNDYPVYGANRYIELVDSDEYTGGLFHVRTTFGDTISEGENVAIVEVYRTEGAHQYEAVYVTVESSNNDVVTGEELLVQLYEGEYSKTQRIVFNNNEEINEDVSVTATIRMDELVPTSFAEVNPEHQSVSFTVTDDDRDVGEVSFESASVTVRETDGSQTQSIRLVRENGTDTAITVNVSVQTGGDVVSLAQTSVTFAGGETEKTLTYTVAGDDTYTGNATATLRIYSNNEKLIGSVNTLTVTVTEDEANPSSSGSSSESSGGGSMGGFSALLLSAVFAYRRLRKS